MITHNSTSIFINLNPLIIGKTNTMIIVKASPTAARMLHIGLVNYLRISNLQKLFQTLISGNVFSVLQKSLHLYHAQFCKHLP